MSDQRVTVWVPRFKDRPALMLQWIDPETGARKSRSAKTYDPEEAETARADLGYELTHGKYQGASRMSWERFRELFEAEYVAPLRANTRRNYGATLDLFERLCHSRSLGAVTERTVSAFAAELRKTRRFSKDGMLPGTLKVRLQFLHTALAWVAGQGLFPRCPKFPTVKVPKKKPQPVPAEAFERLLAAAPEPTCGRSYSAAGSAGCDLKKPCPLSGRRRTRPPGSTSPATGSSSPPSSARAWQTSGCPSTPYSATRWRRCPGAAARSSDSRPWMDTPYVR
jgi:hypothetical protein